MHCKFDMKQKLQYIKRNICAWINIRKISIAIQIFLANIKQLQRFCDVAIMSFLVILDHMFQNSRRDKLYCVTAFDRERSK